MDMTWTLHTSQTTSLLWVLPARGAEVPTASLPLHESSSDVFCKALLLSVAALRSGVAHLHNKEIVWQS